MKRKLGYRNSRRVLNLMAAGLILALAILPGFAKPVVAADPVVLEFQPGVACDFGLKIEMWGGPQVLKQFEDKDGNERIIWAGKGSELVYTNLSTKATLSTKPNGAVQQWTFKPDGSLTQTLLGHNIVILYPTDVPAGPSTTLYVGRVFITIDTNGVFTVQQVNARETDICAALSE